MRRMMAAVGLLLLLGTALEPAQASNSSPERSPYALFGPRSDYHTYASMVQDLQAIRSAHPDLIRMESIGKTYEGRDIWAVKLSDDAGTNDSSEPDVLIFGGIHAREVMGPEVTLYVLNYMLDGYGKNETLTKYVNTKETWFVPISNPDGYAYVRDQGHDWRKNRRPTTGGYIGVDLNRNWGYMFGVDGSTSDNPASEVYHGPYPFSENETAALRDLALRQRFATSLSFHSYGELILYPWGYTSAHAPDYDELSSMGAAMAAWNGYTDEQSCTLYPTHGDSEDWFYANTSTLAFTIELDTDFGPPPSQIDITCPLNREPALYLIGYPNASIRDAGIFSLVSPYNGTVIEPDRPLNVTTNMMNFGSGDENVPVEMVISGGNHSYRNSTSLQLRAGQVGQVVMGWSPPMSVAENYTVDLWTNLTGDVTAKNDQKSGHFKIRTRYGVAINATGNTTASCYPGENATFTLNITSLGNREDDIIFEGSGNPMEWARLPSTVHLPPAGTTTVQLAVLVPRNAGPGVTASITLRAQSITGQGSAGTVSTTTKVLDPAPTAVAGKDVTVNVTQEVSFDGSASRTPTGNLTGYSWDLGDGNRSEGVRVHHAYSNRGKYHVVLTVTSESGWNATDRLDVTVDQSFKIGLVGDAASLKVLPGRNITVNFTVKNWGNGPDTVLISLDALKWNASLDTQRMELSAKEERTVRLRFSAPADSLAGTAALFRVRANSSDNAYARAEATLTATVEEVRSLDFGVAEHRKTADAGGSIWFEAAIRNGGNVAGNITFTVFDVPEGWTVRLSRDNASVSANSTTTLRITADIPAGELAGDNSFSVNGVELTVAVNERRAVEARTDAQSVQVRPKGSAMFNLTLTNRGNAPAVFKVSILDVPAGWLPSETLPVASLQPGENATLTVGLTVSAGTRPGAYGMTIRAQMTADPDVSASVPVVVNVLKAREPATTAGFDHSGLLLPALVLIIVVVAVAAGAVAFSRRKKGAAPERTIQCTGCGAPLHPDCASAAMTCPRCGWKV